jgi:hypothetical protein
MAGSTLKLCYTRINMKSTREFWQRWAESLRRYQLHDLVASFLEAGSPLALLGAQAIYFGGGFFKSDQLSALAGMLEDESETRAFVSFLNYPGASS